MRKAYRFRYDSIWIFCSCCHCWCPPRRHRCCLPPQRHHHHHKLLKNVIFSLLAWKKSLKLLFWHQLSLLQIWKRLAFTCTSVFCCMCAGRHEHFSPETLHIPLATFIASGNRVTRCCVNMERHTYFPETISLEFLGGVSLWQFWILMVCFRTLCYRYRISNPRL